MKLMIRLFLILALVPAWQLIPASSQAAGVWYVAPAPLGDDTASCLSASAPCRTITAALGRAAANDTILVASGIYTENLVIAKSLAIIGAGDGSTVIDGSGVGGVIKIEQNTTVKLSHLTIQNGSTPEAVGAGIMNDGTLNISDSVIRNSVALMGGGIYNSGLLTIDRVLITENKTINSAGAGIFNRGTLHATALTLTNNIAEGDPNVASGGAIFNIGTLYLTATLILENSAGRSGGIQNFGTATISTSIIRRNTALNDGGGISNGGDLTLFTTLIDQNQAQKGAGIFISRYGGFATTHINQVAIVNNQASDGAGGLYHGANSTTIITNTTVSENSAVYGGGLVFADPTSALTLTNVTIASNSATSDYGVSIYVTPYAFTHGVLPMIRNSIITRADQGYNCFGPVKSGGYNIESSSNCGLTAVGDLPTTDPRLAPLSTDEGYARSHALRSDSPAIDSGDARVCPLSDQRGRGRPADGNGDTLAQCDRGAYEFVRLTATVYVPLVVR